MIILVMVLLGVSMNFIQTYRSQRAIDKLRENVTPTATVLRDGNWQEIKRREIVPGDIVRVYAGDLIPGDGQLLESRRSVCPTGGLDRRIAPARKKMPLACPDADGVRTRPTWFF